MVYVYDIVLNLNDELLEFFEWEDSDKIKYIKKVPLVKTDDTFIYNLINNNIKLEDNFIDSIKNKTVYYDNKEKNYPIIIFANGDLAIALLIKDNKTFLYSRLLLDEEYEVMNIASRLSTTKMNYIVINKKDINNNLTREERRIKDVLLNEIKYLYNNNKLDKLNYYYYEYFNELNNNKEDVYKKLISSLNKIDDKHLKLLEVVNLTSKQKGLQYIENTQSFFRLFSIKNNILN